MQTSFVATAMISFYAPVTGAEDLPLPIGLEFVIDDDPPPDATAACALPDPYGEWESKLLPQTVLKRDTYAGYYLSVPFELLHANCMAINLNEKVKGGRMGLLFTLTLGAVSAAMVLLFGYEFWVMQLLGLLWFFTLIVTTIFGHHGFGGHGNTDLQLVIAGAFFTAAIIIPTYTTQKPCSQSAAQVGKCK